MGSGEGMKKPTARRFNTLVDVADDSIRAKLGDKRRRDIALSEAEWMTFGEGRPMPEWVEAEMFYRLVCLIEKFNVDFHASAPFDEVARPLLSHLLMLSEDRWKKLMLLLKPGKWRDPSKRDWRDPAGIKVNRGSGRKTEAPQEEIRQVKAALAAKPRGARVGETIGLALGRNANPKRVESMRRSLRYIQRQESKLK
jgi:hypothetical protein